MTTYPRTELLTFIHVLTCIIHVIIPGLHLSLKTHTVERKTLRSTWTSSEALGLLTSRIMTPKTGGGGWSWTPPPSALGAALPGEVFGGHVTLDGGSREDHKEI